MPPTSRLPVAKAMRIVRQDLRDAEAEAITTSQYLALSGFGRAKVLARLAHCRGVPADAASCVRFCSPVHITHFAECIVCPEFFTRGECTSCLYAQDDTRCAATPLAVPPAAAAVALPAGPAPAPVPAVFAAGVPVPGPVVKIEAPVLQNPESARTHKAHRGAFADLEAKLQDFVEMKADCDALDRQISASSRKRKASLGIVDDREVKLHDYIQIKAECDALRQRIAVLEARVEDRDEEIRWWRSRS